MQKKFCLFNVFIGIILNLWMFVFAIAAEPWGGPITGPPAQTGKTVVFIASDLKNGGVANVYRGLEKACQKLGWRLILQNGEGKNDKLQMLFVQSIARQADGIVFGGFQPDDFPEQLKIAKLNKIKLVGWHAAKNPGATPDLFVNVATDAIEVAEMAAHFVLADAIKNKRPLGVIIFNDNQFAIANNKTNKMKHVVELCSAYKDCRVLSIENVKISDSSLLIPELVPKLLKRYGKSWTYSLAINDIYFDSMSYPLIQAGAKELMLVAAGDGSALALSRIASCRSQQAATIAEPLTMQGYQLADELNRAFAGSPPSGYISRPILVTCDFLKKIGNLSIENELGFESAYSRIWKNK
ncbi:substrate-binding domain-containing protein [Iodobacter sp. HSC-16F04]|uniref:Substrate-binding domain-containing protein n=1 Tax=Iodobacter violaceini TaxID=3044271 RepID=A0ABX0KTL5_9NEIS|nr:substrate-binding domain-containing protein [Iodobacter violacea]NHQ85695.1 substrate-binding domain-containing protein [Iodobacter violacea]